MHEWFVSFGGPAMVAALVAFLLGHHLFRSGDKQGNAVGGIIFIIVGLVALAVGLVALFAGVSAAIPGFIGVALVSFGCGIASQPRT